MSLLSIKYHISFLAATNSDNVGTSDKDENDRDFRTVLQTNGLMSLYSKFVSAGVDNEILWDLDDKHLNEARLTEIEKLKYWKAKEKETKTLPGEISYLPLM